MRFGQWLAVTIALFTALAARASVVKDTLTGTVYPYFPSATDTSGLFGPAGGNLAGAPFSLTYTYNTDDFYLYLDATGYSEKIYLQGVFPSIASTISITINGVTLTATSAVHRSSMDFVSSYYSPPQSTNFSLATNGDDVRMRFDITNADLTSLSFGTPVALTSSTEFILSISNNTFGGADLILVPDINNTVQTPPPTFSLPYSIYDSPQVLTILEVIPYAHIYYTTDGTTPTTASTVYTGPITLNTTQTIQAIAVTDGYANSEIASYRYIQLPPLQAIAPFFSPSPGTFSAPQAIAIYDSTPGGATIYYTTDGTTPTTSSVPYTKPIIVTTSQTIQAVAAAPGYTISNIASSQYIIQPPPTPIVASILGGGDATTNTSGPVTATFPLGSAFTLALLDANGNVVPAAYAFSNAALSENIDTSPLFPGVVAFPYLVQSAGRGVFQTAHLGTASLTINPLSTVQGINPVTLTIAVTNPSSLGTAHREVDALIYPLANSFGIPPQFIKAQMERESSKFDPLTYRYEPLSAWVGDYGGISRHKDLRANMYSSYRYATAKDDRDPALPEGDTVDADDLAVSTQQQPFSPSGTSFFSTCNNIPLVSYHPLVSCIIRNFDGIQNWSKKKACSSALCRSNYNNIINGTVDFTAQTSLAASYGYLQVTYAKARDLNWPGVSGRFNPTLLFDSTANMSVGGGSLYLGVITVVDAFLDYLPNAAETPSGSFQDPTALQNSFRTPWLAYNAGKTYADEVIANIPHYSPMTSTPIF